ncbi:amino acid permease [Priestia aryabhattai]
MKQQSHQLQKHLKNRHMTMIALGGMVGAGLFVGSGVVINSTGPAAIFTYALAGLLVILVVRMMAEMTTVYPEAGSFSEHVRIALGNWGGFSVGWLYWYYWVAVVAIEAIAGASLIQYWLPHAPLWILSLSLMIVLTLTNLFSVKSFGEFEYWFSSIKIAAIIGFLIIGFFYIFGLWPETNLNFNNLTEYGGFTPHGIKAIFQGIVIVMFSFVGSEVVTIAAAESAEPKEAVAKATRSVIWRIFLFFIGSIFVVVCIMPWNDTNVLGSPYVSVLEKLNIPGAAQVMNFVVLVAVLSCLNSGLYSASRMLYGLAQKGDAPKSLLVLNHKGVPVRAILYGTLIGYASVILAYFYPDIVYQFLVNSTGAVALFVYLLVSIAQLKMRARLEKESPHLLQLRMWAYPYLTYLTIMSIIAIFVLIGMNPSMRSQLYMSLACILIVYVAYFFRKKEKKNKLSDKKVG